MTEQQRYVYNRLPEGWFTAYQTPRSISRPVSKLRELRRAGIIESRYSWRKHDTEYRKKV